MDNGEVPNFTIQDIPEDRHEDIVDFMTTHFCRDEATCRSVGFLEDPESVLELQNLWRDVLKQNMALVAFVENEEDEHRPRISGCNITCVTTKDEKLTYEQVSPDKILYKITITIVSNIRLRILDRKMRKFVTMNDINS